MERVLVEVFLDFAIEEDGEEVEASALVGGHPLLKHFTELAYDHRKGFSYDKIYYIWLGTG